MTQTMTYSEYVQLVIETNIANPSWRSGQTFFNVLWDVRPDLSEQIRATPLDPFHQDERLDEFNEFVKENW